MEKFTRKAPQVEKEEKTVKEVFNQPLMDPLNYKEHAKKIYNAWAKLKPIKKVQVEVPLPKNPKKKHLYYSLKEFPGVIINQREMECLKHKFSGLTYAKIGLQLGISERTVEFYLNILRNKTNCKTTRELMKKIAGESSIAIIDFSKNMRKSRKE